jgi:hypothetical protein
MRHARSYSLALVVLILATASRSALAAGKFAAPVQNSFTLTFDDPAALTPGPTNFRTSGSFNSFDSYDDSNAGELASWGTFGGVPDEVLAGVVANSGPNGAGDGAARLYIPSKTGGSYFANMSWRVKGLTLGNSTGAVTFDSAVGANAPVPDMTAGISMTVPVKTTVSNATFRFNFDTGADPVSTDAGSFVRGNVPGLIDQNSSGSRVFLVSPGSLPTNTWSTTVGIVNNANPTGSGWSNASFDPFFSRGPRSFDLTRVGVSFPGGGQIGELLVGSFTMSGPDVLKYHEADFNYDQMVDDADIDMMYAAIRAIDLNALLPPVPDNDVSGKPDYTPVWGVDQVPGVSATLTEKFSLTKTDAQLLDFADVDELVHNVLHTSYGDLDLNGVKSASDRATLVSNLGTSGGWAKGDLNGDGNIDAADLAIFDAPTPGDFNSDGQVEGADLLKWQRQLGSVYTATDLVDWRTNFGAGAATAAIGAVPEPTAAILAATGLLIAVRRRRSFLID